MIQVHGKTILSMEFKSIIKAHDSNPWQFIHPKPNFHWQYQKPNSHWQHPSPILIGNIKSPIFIAITLSKRKEPKIINTWQRKKYHVKMLLWQKRTMAIILWRNSLRAILRIMFSYYEPWNTWTSFCITTSIIYTFYTRGKTFKPTSSSFKLLETMNTAICNSS